ncbi:MAG: cadherin-like beta sandwich domain-containing protein [Verrucomicrobia bacterium]|nr:cadherin-like beta sandwich domain-containing protein [Verrucomicrobiota bacterium]
MLGSNANLASLVPNARTLSPAFAPATTAYALSVPAATATPRMTATSADARSIVAVNGLTVPFGGSSAELPLNADATTVRVAVVPQNGTTEKICEVTVTRSESSATISISETNGIVILVFTGTLESALAVDGPFAPISGATSPYAIVADLDAKFYRAR